MFYTAFHPLKVTTILHSSIKTVIFEVKFSPITYYTSHVGDIDINRILAETSSTWRDLEL